MPTEQSIEPQRVAAAGLREPSTGPNEFMAPPAWRSVDFISDLHLSEETPRTFDAWRDYLLNTQAEAVFILGDLFEAWVGDDSRFTGVEARAAAVLTEAAARRTIGFMVGNRDFLVGRELLDACGLQALTDPTVLCAFGSRVLLSHGDAWCIADVQYQQMRAIVRSPAWQAKGLTLPLAERRLIARQWRSASERAISEHAATSTDHWFDVDLPTAASRMTDAACPVLVHGHTHRPATESFGPGHERHVLSDWDLDHATPPRAQVLRWRADGWFRLTPSEAVGSTR